MAVKAVVDSDLEVDADPQTQMASSYDLHCAHNVKAR